MRALVFGALGSIGNHIFQQFTNDKIETIGTTTNLSKVTEQIIFVDKDNLDNLLNIDNLDIVVWAHGHNFNDNITNFDETKFTTMIDANVTFILLTLNLLLNQNGHC